MAQSQKPFYVILGLVLLAGVAFIATQLAGAGKGGVSIPANVVVTAADTAGFRGYVLGSASAPVEITEYADYTCPHCAAFDQVQFPDIKTRLIDVGKARIRIREFPLEGPGHQHSRIAAHCAACADEQGRYWDVKAGLFQRQMDWVLKGSPMSIFTEIVKAAGLDVPKWTECMKSAKYAGRIQASWEEATKLGVGSTPTFLVGGRLWTQVNSDMLIKLVDSLVAGAGRSATPATPVRGE